MVDRLTLTVNSRLARWLLFHHGRRQFLNDQKVWETPPVYFLDEWLRKIWLNSWPNEYFLNDLQSKHLWQKIIREDSESADFSLLHVQGAASHAAKAFELIQKYRLPVDSSQFNAYTGETRAFHRWMSRYQKQLGKWRALDASQLLDEVSKRMKQGLIPLPGPIRLHGFDEITPQLQDWLSFLENRDVPVEFLPFKPEPVEPKILQQAVTQRQATVQKYEDANEEAIQCARWIRSVYQPGETIGVVVPDLEIYRGIIEREFKAELTPESVYPWVDTSAPFNISLGTPLSHEPMVHLALLLLSLRSMRVPLLTFSTLITSPFLKCPDEEKPFRRELDWDLRGKGLTHVYLPQSLSLKNKGRGPALTALLEAIEKNWLDVTGFHLPSQWARKISNLLKEFEWPAGSGNLSSHSYQTLESWKSCLDDLATLDRIMNRISRHQAVSYLTHIVNDKIFQPQTHEEPIQIVGLLESAGMEFDHLWIMGCHSDALPAVPRPNPFLPFLSHQKPHQLPHSTAERELAFSEQTLYRLSRSSKQMIFSYPAWQGEREMMPSPLITPWIRDPHAIHTEKSFRLQDHPGYSVALENLEDFTPIPLEEEEKKFIRGGTGLIKRQALCPFQAFAVHRLTSQHQDFAEIDMDELAQGSLIHKILELFWQQIQTSERLHNLYEAGTLLNQIQECVDKGLKECNIDIYGQSVFFELEKERLASLLLEWMEYERQRPSFKVLDVERKQKLELNGLMLRLTADRIDELDGGGQVIVDYKTGSGQRLNQWFGERIEEPQLPLYALTLSADALAFAVVNKRKPGYLGLGRDDIVIPGVENQIAKKLPNIEHWNELKEYWNHQLRQTTGEFVKGILTIDPIHEKDTCKVCDQKTLCRKTELLSRFSGEEE